MKVQTVLIAVVLGLGMAAESARATTWDSCSFTPPNGNEIKLTSDRYERYAEGFTVMTKDPTSQPVEYFVDVASKDAGKFVEYSASRGAFKLRIYWDTCRKVGDAFNCVSRLRSNPATLGQVIEGSCDIQHKYTPPSPRPPCHVGVKCH